MTEITLKERNLYLNNVVETSTIIPLIQKIKEIDIYDNNKKIKEPIHLFINSCGGNVANMFEMINCISTCKTPIYTYNTSECLSAGFIIFIAGHKRFSYKNSLFMCHGMNGSLGTGTYQHLKETIKNNIDKQTKFMVDFITEKTLITKKDLNNAILNSKDLYFDSVDALKLKITDEII